MRTTTDDPRNKKWPAKTCRSWILTKGILFHLNDIRNTIHGAIRTCMNELKSVGNYRIRSETHRKKREREPNSQKKNEGTFCCFQAFLWRWFMQKSTHSKRLNRALAKSSLRRNANPTMFYVFGVKHESSLSLSLPLTLWLFFARCKPNFMPVPSAKSDREFRAKSFHKCFCFEFGSGNLGPGDPICHRFFSSAAQPNVDQIL